VGRGRPNPPSHESTGGWHDACAIHRKPATAWNGVLPCKRFILLPPENPTRLAADFFLHGGVAMKDLLSRSWWMLALRGVIGIVFGVLAITWPDITLLTLVVLFAAYALLGGAVATASALQNRRKNEYWWLLMVLGLTGIVTSVIAILHPGLTTLILVLVVAAYALVNGVTEIAVGVQLRQSGQRAWTMILSGVVSIAFGVLIFVFPDAGALALVALVSMYAIFTGALSLLLAMQMRVGGPESKAERRVRPDRRSAAAH
jgi:uncharacterized membrane protein HdeD (DUF308 family)